MKYIGFYGVGNVDCHFDNCGAYGALDAGFVMEKDVDGKFTNSTVHIDNGYRPYFKKTGRNEPCPCGSGVKFKRCHGDSTMSRGIVSTNGRSTFTNTKVVSSGDGIVLEDDASSFHKTEIYAGESVDYAALAKQFGLPGNVPSGLLKDAIDQVKDSGDVRTVEATKLKSWLHLNDFDMAGWASVALSIGAMVFGK